MMSLKVDWLRCFLAVEEHRSFSVAADSLFMTQSSLSKQIKSLEEELGCQLFDRSTHSIKLTQAGEKIVPHAKWIVGEQDRMLHSLSDLRRISKSKLSLAVPFDMSHFSVTDMIIDFELANPGIIAETHEKSSESRLYMLDNHIVDFCIGYREFWKEPDKYVLYPLYQDSLVVVMSKSHPLAELTEFNLGERQDVMFCLPREETGIFQMFLDLCSEAGFSPNLTLSDVRISTIKRYISHGMRITVTSALRAASYFHEEEFLHLPIKGIPAINLSLAVRNERLPPLHQRFITHAQSWYRRKFASS